MNFAFTKEEEKLLGEVRSFLRKEVTPEIQKEVRLAGSAYGGAEFRKFIRKFAANGWFVPHWPEEYGGRNSSEMVAYMIREEMAYSGLPIHYPGAYMAGPIILRYGSDVLKQEFLRRIGRAEIEFALGYTEPDAGSDLMSLRTRAEERDDYFLVNGNKTFNTHCHVAEYHWLAVRTDPEAPSHKGISLLIADLKSPGITVNPMMTMGGYRVNEVFYDDVKVPKKNLIGEKNRGAYYLLEALDYERSFAPGAYRRHLEDIIAYAKETIVDGKPISANPIFRQKLAQVAIELEVGRLLYYRIASMLDKGKVPSYQSAMEKTFCTEMGQRIANVSMEVLGPYGLLGDGSRFAPLEGKVEQVYRTTVVDTIVAGSSEIQRNIIAQRGLGLPTK